MTGLRRRRRWGVAFLTTLVVGLSALAWIAFERPALEARTYGRLGAVWIALLTVTALGFGFRPR